MAMPYFKKTKVKFFIISFRLLAFRDCDVFAEDKINFGLAADYYSKYIWRGQNVNDESVFQPSISLSKWGFTGSIWGNLDLTNENDNSGEFSEFDYTLDYSGEMPDVNWLNFSVGTVHYRFPNTLIIRRLRYMAA